MSTTLEQTNGHGKGGEVDLHPSSPAATTAGTGGGEVDKSSKPKPVFFSPSAREKFVRAAKRAGLTQLDAAELAAELLDKVTEGEEPESPTDRRARLARKVGGQQ